jgi:hypothetical protein
LFGTDADHERGARHLAVPAHVPYLPRLVPKCGRIAHV